MLLFFCLCLLWLIVLAAILNGNSSSNSSLLLPESNSSAFSSNPSLLLRDSSAGNSSAFSSNSSLLVSEGTAGTSSPWTSCGLPFLYSAPSLCAFSGKFLVLPFAEPLSLLALGQSFLLLPLMLVDSLLNLPVSRPLVLLGYLCSLPQLQPFSQGGLVLGLLGALFGSVFGAALLRLTEVYRCPKALVTTLLVCAAACLVADGLLQLPGVLLGATAYPTPALSLALFQVPIGLLVILGLTDPGYPYANIIQPSTYGFLLGLTLMHAAPTLHCSLLAAAGLAVALANLAHMLLPERAMRWVVEVLLPSLHQGLERAATACRWAAQLAAEAALRALSHPLLQGLLHRVLLPAWAAASPWAAPLTAALFTAIWLLPLPAAAAALLAPTLTVSARAHALVALLRCALAGAAGAFITLLLAASALPASCASCLPALNPLHSPALAAAVHTTAWVLALPYNALLSRLLQLAFDCAFWVLQWVLWPLADCLQGFAYTLPVLAVLLLPTGAAALYAALAYSGALRYDPLALLLSCTLQPLEALASTPLLSLAELPLLAELAILLYSWTLHRVAECVQPCLPVAPRPRPAAAQGGTGTGAGAGAAAPPLSTAALEELDDLASTLAAPLQCPACGFGPVDHTGCASLSTHQGQGGVSNACPACGYFSASRADWSAWSLRSPTRRGRAVDGAWQRATACLRAGLKGLTVPVLLLGGGRAAGLPLLAASAAAVAYTVLWADHQSLEEGRERGGAGGAGRGGGGGGARAVASADCGSAARAAQQQQQQPLPQLSESQAMAEILSSTPARVFLQPGDSCAVCLEEYSSAAVEAGGGGGGHVTQDPG